MAEYIIGYGKPPVGGQFGPGNCANPRGRPKKAPYSESAIWQAVMNERVEYREGRKVKRARKIEIMVKSLGEKALKGNIRAAADLLKLRKQSEKAGNTEPVVMEWPESDQKMA